MHPSTKRGFSNFHFDRRSVPLLHFVEHLERTIVRPEFSRLAIAEANGSERVKGLERLSDPVVPACNWRLHGWRTQQKCWVVYCLWVQLPVNVSFSCHHITCANLLHLLYQIDFSAAVFSQMLSQSYPFKMMSF